MIYKINILLNANEDLNLLRRHDKVSYIKCFDIVRELMLHPREWTGKAERLKYFKEEVYSRRINHRDRIVYTIYEEIKEIDISSFKGHYG